MDTMVRYTAPHLHDHVIDSPIKNLSWVDTTQKVAEIVTRSPPIMPILVKCSTLSSYPGIAAKIQPEDIIKLVRVQSVDVVQASVQLKSTAAHPKDLEEYNDIPLPTILSIPRSLSTILFEVIRGSVRYAMPTGLEDSLDPTSSKASMKSNPSPTRFRSVRDLSKQLPRFVKVIKTTKQIRQNTKIVDGHVLEVLGVHSPWATKEKYLSCRIDEPDGQVCKLDLRWKGCYDVIPDTRAYNLQDLLQTYRLPVTVRVRDLFPTEWMSQVVSSQLKVVRTLDLNLTIEREVTMEYVIGIRERQSVLSSSSLFKSSLYTSSSALSASGPEQTPQADFSLLVVSKNIDIDFVTSSNMTMNPAEYQEAMNHLGTVGDSIVSMISKEIYLTEYGSPMVAVIPFAKLQPKKSVCKKPQVVSPSQSQENLEMCESNGQRHSHSSHHYIDLDILAAEDPDAVVNDEHGDFIPDDPYESVDAILAKAATQKCDSIRQRKTLTIQIDETSSPDESLTDYTILRSPNSKSVFRDFKRVTTRDISHYQVPRSNCASDDGHSGEDAGLLMRDVDGDESSTECRCSDSLPRDKPPPIPYRPTMPSIPHKPVSRLSSTPVLKHTPVPEKSNGYNTSTMSTDKSPLAYFSHLRNSTAEAVKSPFVLEMEALLAGRKGSKHQESSETTLPQPTQQAHDDQTMPDSDNSSDTLSIPSPPPAMDLPSPLPSPPWADEKADVVDLPMPDFPPPVPTRSSSLASLESIGSTTSTQESGSGTIQTELKSIMSQSLTNFTFPKQEEISSATKVQRSHSCSPTQLRNPRVTRNLAAARRKLPDIPTEEQQAETSPSFPLNFPLSGWHTLKPRLLRPSSSGNLLDDIRPPPPLPRDRASSMENLLAFDKDTSSDDDYEDIPKSIDSQVVSVRNTKLPATPQLETFQQPTSTLSPVQPCQQSALPTANIAPQPSTRNILVASSLQSPPLPSRTSPPRPSPIDVAVKLNRRSPPIPPHTTSSDDSGSEPDSDYLNPDVGVPIRNRRFRHEMWRPMKPVPERKIPPPLFPRVNMPKITSIKDIPDDISRLNCDQVSQVLELLKVSGNVIDAIKSLQMNGELLQSMTEEILQTEFNMSPFCAIKVIKFVNGWRPDR